MLHSYLRQEEPEPEGDDRRTVRILSPTPRPKKQQTFAELSKQLQQKNKRQEGSYGQRRSSKRYEEVYTDKDRAAAVNMGSKDIKQSLKMKRKQDRSKALEIPEETQPNTLMALAKYHTNVGNLRLAIGCINKALELNEADKKALVARSKCHLLSGQPAQALRDAQAALDIDKSFAKGLYQKAEALYHLGEFEQSLMYHHRGLSIRPQMKGFKLGVQKAQEAIENVIGSE
ncbi:hypothetical protein AAG570_002014 [Ranatra chinensis]|uniref:Outer dynein arm-docking complex subunit 4 n=1 Tax=Ranatra chinensis TaxID=642074 RepID=A0ABD0YYG2_9HEMI